MAAYIVADIDIIDPVAFEEYRQMTPGTLSPYCGTYLVRGGHHEVIEGSWNPKRIVILRFDTMGQAKQWYQSPEYAKALPIRKGAAISNLVLVEGI